MGCKSARGPDADRHVKLLIQFVVKGLLSGAYSQASFIVGGLKVVEERSWQTISPHRSRRMT
jgi:hypothetical protein